MNATEMLRKCYDVVLLIVFYLRLYNTHNTRRWNAVRLIKECNSPLVSERKITEDIYEVI